MEFKDIAIEFLKTVHIELDKLGIEHWLQNGTSLGVYREGDFIGDNWKDIDIGFHTEDMEAVREVFEKAGLVLKHEWQRELCYIHKTDKCTIKFDCFFHTKDEENIYWYAYKKNKTDGKWDIEWRKTFKLDEFFPLTRIEFLGEVFNMPGKIEQYLETIYGEWKIPAPWKYENYEKVQDKDYNKKTILKTHIVDYKEKVKDIIKGKSSKKIAICLTTFMRDETILDNLENLTKYSYKVYLADQGFFTVEKEAIYEKYRNDLGWEIFYAPFDCGLSYARNMIMQRVSEPFLFLTDDDIHLREPLETFLEPFAIDQDLGIVGGQIFNHITRNYQVYSHKLSFEDSYLSYKPIKEGYCDIVLNAFLARTKVFEDIKWDNNLKIVEHSDFFLRLKLNTNWKVFYDPKLVADHYPIRSEHYKKFRTRPQFMEIFKDKWNIQGIK